MSLLVENLSVEYSDVEHSDVDLSAEHSDVEHSDVENLSAGHSDVENLSVQYSDVSVEYSDVECSGVEDHPKAKEGEMPEFSDQEEHFIAESMAFACTEEDSQMIVKPPSGKYLCLIDV